MNKKRAAAGAAAVVLAASVGVNLSFEARELMLPADRLAGAVEYAPVRLAGEDPLAEGESFERISLPDALRARFIRLPVAVKATVLLPLWALGALPAAAASALGPVWGALLGVLVQLGLLLGLFSLVYKLLFPKKKLRELFRKKNLKWLAAAAVTAAVVNVLLADLWTGWPLVRTLLTALVGMGVLALLWKRLCGAARAPEPEVVRTRMMLEF